MRSAEDRKKVDEIWNLVKHEHAAVLVSIRKDGSLDSIPMGCVQRDFDGTLWFLTFKDNPRLHEIEERIRRRGTTSRDHSMAGKL